MMFWVWNGGRLFGFLGTKLGSSESVFFFWSLFPICKAVGRRKEEGRILLAEHLLLLLLLLLLFLSSSRLCVK